MLYIANMHFRMYTYLFISYFYRIFIAYSIYIYIYIYIYIEREKYLCGHTYKGNIALSNKGKSYIHI